MGKRRMEKRRREERAVRFFGDIVPESRIKEIITKPSKDELKSCTAEILAELGYKQTASVHKTKGGDEYGIRFV